MKYTITGTSKLTGERFERTFWIPHNGGYVHEVTPERPGTLGYQVCEGLAHTGHTLTATPETLPTVIQRERARERRWEDQAMIRGW